MFSSIFYLDLIGSFTQATASDMQKQPMAALVSFSRSFFAFSLAVINRIRVNQMLQLLLILQFIWSLNLTQEELPDENPPFLRQLGLEKPREYPAFVSLLGNCIFTAMFWVTLKQHIHEKAENKRRDMAEGIGAHPFHVAFTTAYSDLEKPSKRRLIRSPAPNVVN